jgi:hypothetical protein
MKIYFNKAGLICFCFKNISLHLFVKWKYRQFGYLPYFLVREDDGSVVHMDWFDGPLSSFGIYPFFVAYKDSWS